MVGNRTSTEHYYVLDLSEENNENMGKYIYERMNIEINNIFE